MDNLIPVTIQEDGDYNIYVGSQRMGSSGYLSHARLLAIECVHETPSAYIPGTSDDSPSLYVEIYNHWEVLYEEDSIYDIDLRDTVDGKPTTILGYEEMSENDAIDMIFKLHQEHGCDIFVEDKRHIKQNGS